MFANNFRTFENCDMLNMTLFNEIANVHKIFIRTSELFWVHSHVVVDSLKPKGGGMLLDVPMADPAAVPGLHGSPMTSVPCVRTLAVPREQIQPKVSIAIAFTATPRTFAVGVVATATMVSRHGLLM